jgi:hypothetical protein
MSWSAVRSFTALVVVAVAATIVMTWPLAPQAATSVQDLGDPLLQIWTLKWDLHQLSRDPLRLYEANTFRPFPAPLAYSESMLAIALLFAPIWWLTGNDVLAYNTVLLLTFAGSIVTATLLARQFTRWTAAALLAGLAFAFMPYRFGHLSHLNLLSLQWLPLVLLCLIRFLQTGRRGWAIGLTVAFLLQALSSFYYAYLAAIACAVIVVVMLPRRDGRSLRSRLIGLAVVALVVGLVMVPVSAPYFSVRQSLDFERTAQDVDEMAATPRSYLSVAPESRLYRKRLPERYPNPLFPGTAVLLLAAIGLATARGRPVAAIVAVGLTGFILSFGLSLSVAGREIPLPYALLYDYLPGARGLRDVARFGVLPLLALAVLAAAGLGWVMDRLTAVARSVSTEAPPATGAWRRWAALGLASLVSVVTLVELASGSVRATPVERDAATMAPYAWLASQPPGLVMEFPADGVRGNVTRTTRYMYNSSYHWQPHLLGYSGFVPPLHYELVANFPDDRRTATPSLLTVANVGLLQDLDVRYVLFHRPLYSGGGWRLVQENLARIDDLAFVGQLGNTWVYTLARGDRQPVRAEVLLPNRALAGQEYTAHYALQNANLNRAASAFGGKANVVTTWRDPRGSVVASSTVSLQPGAIVEPGTRLVPLVLGSAPPAGDYRLTLTSTDPRIAPLLPASEIAVSVADGPSPPSREPAKLAELSWPAGSYRPGQAIPVRLTWSATGPLPGHVVFFQLIGGDNRVWGQRDGQPLDGRRAVTNWLAGERIDDRRDLLVAPDAPPGQYRLLAGLYDPATGQRATIAGPDGRPTTEVWSAELTISPPG